MSELMRDILEDALPVKDICDIHYHPRNGYGTCTTGESLYQNLHVQFQNMTRFECGVMKKFLSGHEHNTVTEWNGSDL
jgi:hypothetical protein